MTRPLRVFLCHSSNDKLAVRELYQKLRAEPWIQPWLDEEELYPGQDWNMEIEKAVETADAIIVCLSKGSITKEGYIQRELRIVLDFADYKPEGTLYIIPVRLEECEPPRRLRAWQYADYFEGQRDRAFQRLLVSLKRRADGLGLAAEELIDKKIEEQAKREEAEKTAREKLELDAIEKTKREKAEREAKEKSNREAAARVAREKLEHEANQQEKPVVKPLPVVENKKEQGNKTASKNNLLWLGVGGIILFALILGGLGLNSLLKNLPVATATPVISPSATLKPVTPTKTKIPQTSTPVPPTFTPTFTPIPQAGSTLTTTQDDMVMVYIPEGEFIMGNNDSDAPVHTVYLNAFWIDQTEVTNKQYKACVDAGTCEPPSDASSHTHPSYYGNPEFNNYPVLYVNWDKANRYCEVWKEGNGDLPTEAQWEKAARGTDARTYPWGNEAPSNNLLNYYGSNVGDTTEVGAYPSGASFYDAYDIAGNVWEWVNDWYDKTYYDDPASANNPIGPETGQYRVLRGGSWGYNGGYVIRTADRDRDDPSGSNDYVGFRCSRSP